jgi:hypothetical protein
VEHTQELAPGFLIQIDRGEDAGRQPRYPLKALYQVVHFRCVIINKTVYTAAAL